MSPIRYFKGHWRAVLGQWTAVFAGVFALMLIGGETALAAVPAALLASAVFVVATAGAGRHQSISVFDR